MAKRSRRVRKPRLSPTQLVQPTAAVGPTAERPSDGQSSAQTPDLKEEYRYVVADLRRIGLIAAVMLAVLVVLAFLLT